MHEMGICQSILDASFEAARDGGAERIREIRITVGELTEIQDFALDFAFQSLTPGTMAEGATLTVTHVEPRSRCLQCGTEYTHDRFQMVCPKCGSMAVELLQGRELTIDSIEVDDGATIGDEPDAASTDDQQNPEE